MQFTEWITEKESFEKGFGKKIPTKNEQGGFDPTKDQIAKFKKIDLITLPVAGTNCGNCMFMKPVDDVGFCTHKDVQEYITNKMCCVFWNNTGVKRKWD